MKGKPMINWQLYPLFSNKLVNNSQQLYELSECVTINVSEILRKKSHDFLSEMPSEFLPKKIEISSQLCLDLQIKKLYKYAHMCLRRIELWYLCPILKSQKLFWIITQQKETLMKREKSSIFSSRRRTRRWAMVVFYRIVDLSGISAYILYNMHQPKIIDRLHYIF